MQATVLNDVGSIGKKLSPDSRHVLAFVEESPAAAAPVAIAFLTGVLTQTGGVPPPPLVDASMALYEKSRDVDLLALVLPGLPPPRALALSDRLLGMPLDKFRAAIRRVVRKESGAGAVNAKELLVHLHLVDISALNVRRRRRRRHNTAVARLVSRPRHVINTMCECIDGKDGDERSRCYSVMCKLTERVKHH